METDACPWMVLRSSRDPQQMGAAIRNTLHLLDAGLPVNIERRYDEMATSLFPSQMATMSLGVMGLMGAILSITGIFGMAAYSVSKRLRELGIRVLLGRSVRKYCRQRWGGPSNYWRTARREDCYLGFWRAGCWLPSCMRRPLDPVVLAGVVLAMAMLGLLAPWIPARRALSVNPMILLREE
jgi:hypothetical protein